MRYNKSPIKRTPGSPPCATMWARPPNAVSDSSSPGVCDANRVLDWRSKVQRHGRCRVYVAGRRPSNWMWLRLFA